MSAVITAEQIPASLVSQVVALHRAAFSREKIAHTIYACPGVDRYLASLAAFPRLQPDHVLWGAWNGGDLYGYAHFRALPGSWHLNNIAVHPTCQGLGVGRLLWSFYCEMAYERGYERITLDVESDNHAAIDWYHRQGLHLSAAAYRYEKPLAVRPPGCAPASLSLTGWDQAEAWQAAYGFSKFQISHAGRVWEIGRVGSRYFKVSQPLPAPLEQALFEIDPGRCLLVISPQPLADPEMRMVGKSWRMTGYLPAGR